MTALSRLSSLTPIADSEDIAQASGAPPAFPVCIICQAELIHSRIVHLLSFGGGLPKAFHGSTPHSPVGASNTEELFFYQRPPTLMPRANWAPAMDLIFQYLELMSRTELLNAVDPIVPRTMSYVAGGGLYWMFKGDPPLESREILGISAAQRARMVELAMSFCDDRDIPDLDTLSEAMGPMLFHRPGQQQAGMQRCLLFTQRDLGHPAEYLIEVTEVLHDLIDLGIQMQGIHNVVGV
ncbi:hypothetical protein CYLTODRAFT_459823 [Cylindrobasidium torrendii FP15055 ss-10]|uniref:Uncharacterized protein n=1 Tax=Cylindrobasidium torrendii FP15055 ss-10 TaxID=1314674 RepID=A0A0D7AW39_9AGAR|nr:hypothetical protein CYLTODRAFT_459823 [Cylindrobasidium torrendii FP15055 ss-10]